MRRLQVVILSALSFTPLAAQSEKPGSAANSAVSTNRMIWDRFTQFIVTVAEETPESTYAYRPTPEVRSLGQLVGHVANAQYFFCSTALGEPGPKEDIEKTRTRKAELVTAIKESTKYCERAYGQTDRAAQQSAKLFGEQRTRLFVLGLNAAHNAEHYGNIVTYLRLNGIVPPSSREGS